MTMDYVRKHGICTNIPTSQTFRYYLINYLLIHYLLYIYIIYYYYIYVLLYIYIHS
jgi:hypothetical protein